MDSGYQIRNAEVSDLDTLFAFAPQEANETEGDDPDTDGVVIGVQAGLEGAGPSTYWVAESRDGQIVASGAALYYSLS
jgi:hypothetical protein